MTPPDAPGPRPEYPADVQSALTVLQLCILDNTDAGVQFSVDTGQILLSHINDLRAQLAAERERADQAERRGIERAMATLLEKSAWLRQYGHADSAPPIDRCAGWIAALLTPEAPHE